MQNLIRIRCSFSNENKTFVFYLIFESLTEEKPALLAITQIRDITDMMLTSRYSIIRDWRKKSHVISHGMADVSRRTKVTFELKRILEDSQMLT